MPEKCPACGGTALSSTITATETMFGRDETFPYAECSDCGTLWLTAVPAQLGTYYPTDYYSVDLDPEVALGRPGVRSFAKRVSRSVLFGNARLARVARALIGKREFHSFVRVLDSVAFAGLPLGARTRILDVGCGSGLMVYALATAGVEAVVGVDPFAPGDRLFDNGARLMRSELGDVDETFDLVMFHHSFEHVPDPAASLADAVRLLAPGGQILIRMPTRSSHAYETYGPNWVQLDAPRHLTIFSRNGIETLAEGLGLAVKAVKDDSNAFQFWGSEQVARGIPLMSAESHLMSEKRSTFTRAQIDRWERESRTLNECGRGDQAAWLLVRQ